MLGPAFDWFLESNLTRCFQEHPQLRGLLYYNRATTTLTMEDPQLKFFLRALDWEKFAEASGHGHVIFYPEDGPIWLPPISASANIVLGAMTGSGHAVVTAAPRRVLHLSDLHFATQDQATVSYAQLAADLRQQGITDRLDALVVSGDLVNRAEPAEYDAARLFLEHLMSGFGLSGRQVVLVPGNHDVSWSLAQASYGLRRRSQQRGALPPGTFIEHGADVIDVRDEETYSAWAIDHHYRDRASIHPEALAKALLKLGPATPAQLRIATFHHPIQSDEESRIKDDAFLQQLAVHGFRIVLHGHVHKEGASVYRYDRSVDGRQLEVIAAGTFGAPTREWVQGYALEYNVLLVGSENITVETRCRREVNGAWEPYARWQRGPGMDPLPRYVIGR